MPENLTKPPLYRLTLRHDAMLHLSVLMANQTPPRLIAAALRPDGKYDVGISMSLLDQLQTAALPKENLSDALIRVMKGVGR